MCPRTAVINVFDNPTLKVHSLCKPNDKIMALFQIYKICSPKATSSRVGYMIDAKNFEIGSYVGPISIINVKLFVMIYNN